MSNHNLTGEPYLGIVMHCRPRLFPRWVYRHYEHVFIEERTDERGRQYSRPRKWPNLPDHLLTKFHWWARPHLCRFLHIHDQMDIIEIDASVWRAECTQCHRLVPAHEPKKADPAEVKRWHEISAEGDELADKLDAWWDSDKMGECPICGKENGDHTLTCWEDDRTAEQWARARVDRYLAEHGALEVDPDYGLDVKRQPHTPHPEPDATL